MKRMLLPLLLVIGAQSAAAWSCSSSSSSCSSSSYTIISLGQKYDQAAYENIVARNRNNPKHFAHTTSIAQLHTLLIDKKCKNHFAIVDITKEDNASPLKNAIQGYGMGLVTGLSSIGTNKDANNIAQYLKARFPHATHVLLFDPFLFEDIKSLSAETKRHVSAAKGTFRVGRRPQQSLEEFLRSFDDAPRIKTK